MIKKMLLGAAMLLCVASFAQERTTAEMSKDNPSNARHITLAGELINYGYETESALPLIQAIKIYHELNVKEANDGLKPTTTENETPNRNITKKDQPIRNEKQLIEDATAFAKGDKNLLAMINECKSTTRSPIGGPIGRYSRVPAFCNQDWVVGLIGGQATTVAVSGDGTTDLDLYVFDQNGILVASETSYGDQCYIILNVYITSNFDVRVVNRGSVYNDYQLLIF